MSRRLGWSLSMGLLGVLLTVSVCIASDLPCQQSISQWRTEMLSIYPSNTAAQVRRICHELEKQFPLQWDWMLQDAGVDFGRWFEKDVDPLFLKEMINTVLTGIGSRNESFLRELKLLIDKKVSCTDARWLDLYFRACRQRRRVRMEPLLRKYDRIVFTKHYNLGGSHYAYTEGQSDAQHERHFQPGSALCLLELNESEPVVRTFLSDPGGVIRDPDVSYDGKSILFSWKKSDRQDDYHLYEMDVVSGEITQITSGLGFADYEGVYLPNGDVLFNSTRCVQTVDCWWTEVSNLYTCDRKGRYLRRLGFDQVHTNYPQVLGDGRVIYTRWDYNDRGQIYPQPLFQMNIDGTAQTEFYGNNSWFPTTILHARPIPETQKVMAIATGHHSIQIGKLIVIDPAKGRQEAQGVQLIAPIQTTEAVRIDAYGQEGDVFQYPYPLSEDVFLVCFYPEAAKQLIGQNGRYDSCRFKIYFMTADGRRELLVADQNTSCNQPVALSSRSVPHLQPGRVDYTKDTGVYYVQDVYAGPGLGGISRGIAKKIRVVSMEFRAAGIGDNRSGGPGGGALASTPVSIDNGCWDVKVVLGDAKIHEDGSSCFTVPARIPVYFQVLDDKSCVIQSMRSWSTLQPGETFSCVGCHEDKNGTPPSTAKSTMAMRAGPQDLEPFYGPPRGFSFTREIQPILDRHCIRCHDGQEKPEGLKGKYMFSLLGTTRIDPQAKRKWSQAYLTLTQEGNPNEIVQWLNVQSIPSMLPPYYAGSAKSELVTILEQGHYEVKLSREEMDKLICWIDLLVPFCGDYTEANAWTDTERDIYNHFVVKREQMAKVERENINQMLNDRDTSVWDPMEGSPNANLESMAGQRAIRLSCRFEGTRMERASWDRTFNVDLSMHKGIEFRFLCKDLSPIAYFTFYFHSGNGWYATGFAPEKSDKWQTIRVDKSGVRIEGEPAGWGSVDKIRISAWRGQDKNTDFYVTDFTPYGGEGQIVILRNDAAIAQSPDEARGVQQYTETMSQLLDGLGISYVTVSDRDITAQKLASRSLIILPYNPGTDPQTEQELVTFVKTGGKILACYILPASLEPLLSIHLGQHMKQEFTGQFASIRPDDSSLKGFPNQTAQASWNIRHAVGLNQKARAVAWWYDKDGENTGQPAVVAGENGVFMTHVLLGDGTQNKSRLLLSLLGHLEPSIWAEAARGRVGQIGTFGSFKGYNEAFKDIQTKAKSIPEAQQMLETARKYYEQAVDRIEKTKYVEALAAASQSRASLLEAFYLAQRPQSGEHRAFWCHSATGVAQMTWEEAIKILSDNGFTAILPNMLWGGVAFYPSDVLPVSPTVKERGDQIAECLMACKKYGVQCHVWKVNYNMGWATDAAFMQEMKSTGRTQVTFDGGEEPRWLCPSHPANKQLEIDSMVEVVRKYDVDGIHYDYIRYPGRQSCFCEGCRRRFEKYVGQAITDWPLDIRNDEHLSNHWDAFRQQQITDVVEAVATQTRKVRPGVKIS
ncbi:MAG: family 10 glycosylhydrolase, partial [Sedimentisphaerales bacterium]|nr:family 10 glycosylhydrolase [Sedimentisphaerales bacterium]